MLERFSYNARIACNDESARADKQQEEGKILKSITIARSSERDVFMSSVNVAHCRARALLHLFLLVRNGRLCNRSGCDELEFDFSLTNYAKRCRNTGI